MPSLKTVLLIAGVTLAFKFAFNRNILGIQSLFPAA